MNEIIKFNGDSVVAKNATVQEERGKLFFATFWRAVSSSFS